MELSQLIYMPPTAWADPAERSYDISAVREQLGLRGVDVDALIRYGIGYRLPLYITTFILLPMLEGDDRFKVVAEGEALEDLPQPSAEWIDFFESSYLEDISGSAGRNDKLDYALHGFMDRIRSWLEVSSTDDIIAWKAPTGSDLTPVPRGQDQRPVCETARWLIDRFTIAYVSEWALSSLRLEWRYLKVRLPAPISSTAMAERKVDANAIAIELSDKVTDSVEVQRAKTNSFVPVAATHLRNGNRDLAIAIFEALVAVSPQDAEAHNNLGFCLLPDSPLTALSELEQADKLSGGTITTLANRVLALHLMGRDKDALALARSETAENLPSEHGVMWLIDKDHEFKLSDSLDVRKYLEFLAGHIEREFECEADV
jgi:hypothetical protein